MGRWGLREVKAEGEAVEVKRVELSWKGGRFKKVDV
jgi:hypothetical protein